MQPNAKFIISLSDPVQRLYSDYHFLDDDRTVVRPGKPVVTEKSAEIFHERCVEQVRLMELCVDNTIGELLENGHRQAMQGETNRKGAKGREEREKGEEGEGGEGGEGGVGEEEEARGLDDLKEGESESNTDDGAEGGPLWFRASQM